MGQRFKLTNATFAMLLVLTVYVMYQLYNMTLQLEGSVKPRQVTEDSQQEAAILVHDLSEASDVRYTNKKVYLDIAHNDTIKSIKSPINVLYSESAVSNMINLIKEEAAKLLKLPQENCEQRLPQCLNIGNYKCGTRELLDYMSMHPRIEVRNIHHFYEISFFGLEWYRKEMPCSFSYQITVEKSPGYFHNMEAPARIHRMNSSIKLIALVREPVSKTISWFTFWRSLMKQFHYNLDEYVLKQPSGDINVSCPAVKESIYDEGIRRFMKFFKNSQIKIIEAEYFKRNPYKVLREIEEYLDIEHVIKSDNFVYIEQKGVFCLRQNRESQNVSCYSDRKGRNTTQVKNSIKYSNMTLHKLKSFFQPHNDNFFRLINKTFDW